MMEWTSLAFTPGTTYYWVIACNAAGCSGYTTSDSSCRAASAPTPPTGVTGTDGTYTDRVRVSWTASSSAAS